MRAPRISTEILQPLARGPRQVALHREQIADDDRTMHALESLLELLDGQAPGGGVVAQPPGGGGALGVPDPDEVVRDRGKLTGHGGVR